MDKTFESKGDTIYLGLCLAGAISAGAYTAGVMDYLLEALQVWEERRKDKVPDTPSHHVVIPVIGGASAGGMTGIITAATINGALKPVASVRNNVMEKRHENKLYHSWVDLLDDDMFPQMLDCSDIQKGRITSLLNSSFIDAIAERAIKVDNSPRVYRPYISDTLKVFVTLSNLEGFQYPLEFISGNHKNGKYIISRHSDFACFVLNNNENAVDYGNDGWIPIDFQNEEIMDLVKGAAMATGAFPIGLRSRKISRLPNYVEELIWSRLGSRKYTPAANPYETLNVDGGMLNNEPFERVRDILKDITNEELRDYNSFCRFKSTVLMIDPFPSTESSFKADDSLFGTIGHTFSAIIGHLRVKPDHVVNALNTDFAGQFLIAPKRDIPNNGEEFEEHGDKAIASGSLGGFGGFLHKELRVHDFYLGRANCERFLRHHFTVPAEKENPILKNGYANVQNQKQFTGLGGLQIIPIFTIEKEDFYMPTFTNGENWPLRKEVDITRFKPMVKKRVGKLLMNMAELNQRDRLLLWAGKELLLKRKFTRYAMQKMMQSFEEHRLIVK